MTDPTDIQLVDRPDQLTALADELRDEPWLALDTEFLRERTYRPKLCLLQIATPQRAVCVDPLGPGMTDLAPLMDVIYDPEIIKVLHSASQDLEIFYWMRRRVPRNIFDTQIAAPLAGHAEQAGYAELVRERLAVELDKAHTRADWTRRPLPADQLRYAADDVIYLARLYPGLRDELEALGRLAWLVDDWEALTRSELYERSADQMWLRLRGVDRLGGDARAVARDLATWRELTARKRNLPRTWLIKDRVVLDLARRCPGSLKELRRVNGVGEATARRYGKRLLQIIEEAQGRTPPDGPPRRGRKLSQSQGASVARLEAAVEKRARELDLAPGLLATRKGLEALVRGDKDCAVLRGWRGRLVGQELTRLLDGAPKPAANPDRTYETDHSR